MNDIRSVFSAHGLTVATAPFSEVTQRPVEGAKTVLISALPYWFPPAENQNLARFAALPDYHSYFGEILRSICNALQESYPHHFFLPFTDNSPIDEQKAALLSGLAAKGKSNLCITNAGSFVFLGEVITDLEVTLTATPPDLKCADCNRCLRACPNGALTEEGFDYRKCLAYITQKKGELAEDEIAALRRHNLVWGCDRCAEACPHNQGLPTAAIALPPNQVLPHISSKEIEGMSDRVFRETFANRAFAWRGKATMLRNLKISEE